MPFIQLTLINGGEYTVNTDHIENVEAADIERMLDEIGTLNCEDADGWEREPTAEETAEHAHRVSNAMTARSFIEFTDGSWAFVQDATETINEAKNEASRSWDIKTEFDQHGIMEGFTVTRSEYSPHEIKALKSYDVQAGLEALGELNCEDVDGWEREPTAEETKAHADEVSRIQSTKTIIEFIDGASITSVESQAQLRSQLNDDAELPLAEEVTVNTTPQRKF